MSDIGDEAYRIGQEMFHAVMQESALKERFADLEAKQNEAIRSGQSWQDVAALSILKGQVAQAMQENERTQQSLSDRVEFLRQTSRNNRP